MQIERISRITADSLPKKIKAARIKDGRSVQVLATYAGLSMAYWYQIEKGDIKLVREETLRKIEEVLDVDFEINFKPPIAA